VEELHRDPTVGPRPKVWIRGKKMEVVPKRRAGEAQMQGNPEGGELDPAECVRRRCKKNSSVHPA